MDKKIFQNAIFKSLLNVCNIIIPIIIGPYVLRILDRQYYDTFNGLNATFQFFLVFGGFGIYVYGVREISRIRDNIAACNRFFTEMFVLGCITNVVAFAAYVGFALWGTKSQLETVLALILTIQFLSNVFNVEWLNEANENYSFIAIKSIVVKVAYLVGIFLLVRHADDIIWYTLLLVLSAVLNSLASFLYIRKKYRFSWRGIQLKKYLSPLLQIFVISNVMLMYAQLDKLMLRMFVSDASVTAYQISQYISSILYSLLVSFVTVAIPRVSNLWANGQTEEGRQLHKNVTDTFYMLFIPVCMGLTLLSKEVVVIYGGDQYLDCAVALALYGIVQLVSSLHYILGESFLYIAGKESTLLKINIAGALVNGILNVILVVCGGYTANSAIVTLIIAYGVVGYLDWRLVKKELGYRYPLFNRHILVYLAAALAFVPVVILVKTVWSNVLVVSLVSFFLCAVVYGLVLFVCRDSVFMGYAGKIRNVMKKH